MSDIDPSYIDQAARPSAPRRVRPVRWAVLAACLSLAVGAVVLFPLLIQQPAVSPSAPTSAPSSGGEVSLSPPLSGEVPAWYAPGQLSARTLTYTKDQLLLSGQTDALSPLPQPSGLRLAAPLRKVKTADNREISLPSDARVVDCYNAALLQLDPQTVKGHEGCSGLFFDTETGKLICLSENLKEKLSAQLPKGGDLRVAAYSGESNRCHFIVQNDRSRTDYVYDFQSETLIELPALVGETDTVAALFPLFTPDLRMAAVVDASVQQGRVPLYLVHIGETDARLEHIADYKDEYVEPFKRLQFSPDGRYLAYAVPDEESYILVGTTVGEWTMRDLATGGEWQGKGRILRFTADGRAVIVRTESQVLVRDLATGEDITDSASLEEWEKLEVTAVDMGDDFTGSRYRITVTPLFGGEAFVAAEEVGAYCQSGDYLYTYSHGDKAAVCRSLTSGEAFQVPVDDAYWKQTTSLPDTLLVRHELYRSQDGTRLLVRFSTSRRNRDAEVARYAQDYNFPNLQKLFETYGSLAEMEAYFLRGMNPPALIGEGGFVTIPSGGESGGGSYVEAPRYAYFQGDGYACVVHRTDTQKQTLLFVDDYRDGTFTIYTCYGSPLSYWPIRAEGNTILRKALPADAARADTVALYTSLPVYEDPVDLAEYYTGGRFDDNKMKQRELDFDRIRTLAPEGYIFNYANARPDGSVWESYLTDISPVEELLRIAKSKPTIGWVTLQAERETKGATMQYWIQLGDVLEFHVSRLADGRGMVLFNSCYRALEDDEYARMLEICRALDEGGEKPVFD